MVIRPFQFLLSDNQAAYDGPGFSCKLSNLFSDTQIHVNGFLSCVEKHHRQRFIRSAESTGFQCVSVTAYPYPYRVWNDCM